jgi:hypothetical protein
MTRGVGIANKRFWKSTIKNRLFCRRHQVAETDMSEAHEGMESKAEEQLKKDTKLNEDQKR